MHALLWCMCLTLCFCDRGTVRSPCNALRDASRRLFPTQRDSVTPHPSVTLVDQPRVSGRVIAERSLSSPCREKKKRLLWAAVSCESLPRPTRHSLDALWCVSHGTPDSDCPLHTRAQSAYTHLAVRLVSE